ncbi:MAG: hypothetical protein BWK80_44800 [Desulfobacteraceae bacterium IS3]|nr:MAG: hypothetical protein BWK80_44800 [Desulfobacteraceae bacterium IS3]
MDFSEKEKKMGWKFWQKNKTAEPETKRRTGPKEIPPELGRYMVISMKLDPDWVWDLRSIARPKEGEAAGTFEIRLFKDYKIKEAGLSVKDYNSLDDYPELIAFQGWYVRGTKTVEITDEIKKRDPCEI